MSSVTNIFFVLWFFLPAGIANMTAFFSGKIPLIKQFTFPADAYLKFRGKRLLGSHKTVRGFVWGSLVAVIICYLQVFFYNELPFVRTLIKIDYNQLNPIFLGFLSGFGALAGDAFKSFFKRQMDIAPGKSWFPFDQIDYIVGGIAFTALYIRLSFWDYVLLFIVWFLLHPLTTFIGYLFNLKKEPL